MQKDDLKRKRSTDSLLADLRIYTGVEWWSEAQASEAMNSCLFA